MGKVSEAEVMNKLYKDYGLTPDDIVVQKHYKIIGRQGMDKILGAANNIVVQITNRTIIPIYEDTVVEVQSAEQHKTAYATNKEGDDGLVNNTVTVRRTDHKVIRKYIGDSVVFEGIFTNTETGRTVPTTGEASPLNCKMFYPAAMAEKRFMARGVLKILGFYEHKFYSEEEADDFAAQFKAAKSSTGGAKFKM